ncbi:MAG: hypothetical protein ABUM26_04695 [Solirubrobacterales bacterium]
MLAAVALGMGSFGVAGASATTGAWMEFPLSSTTPATVSGTLQLSESMAGTVSCPVLTTPASTPPFTPTAFNGASGSAGRFMGTSRQTCSNGKQFEVSLSFFQQGGAPGSWTVLLQGPINGGAQASPLTVLGWSTTWVQNANVLAIPLTNGAGGVPTKLTFNNTTLGYQYHPSMNLLKATGTLDVTTPGGGTLTLGLR